MKILNTKLTKRQQVFEILDKKGYILDDQTSKIFGENKLWCVSEHIRIWKKLQTDRNFFKDVKIVEKKKGYRCHLVRTKNMKDGQYYKVGKEFYNEIELSPVL